MKIDTELDPSEKEILKEALDNFKQKSPLEKGYLTLAPADRDKFPGLDFSGKLGVYDFVFSERLERIHAVGQLQRENTKNALVRLETSELFTETQKKAKSISAEAATMEYCGQYVQKEHASHSDLGKLMVRGGKKLYESAELLDYDKMLTAMEYSVGLRKDDITPEQQKFHEALRDYMVKAAETKGDFHRGFLDARTPENLLQLKIHFESDEARHDQEQAFGKKDQLPRSHASDYAMATVNRLLNPLYGKLERDIKDFTREKAIFIDGVSLDARLGEKNLDGLANKEERKRQSAEILAAALMTGHQVECLRPDPDEKNSLKLQCLSPQRAISHRQCALSTLIAGSAFGLSMAFTKRRWHSSRCMSRWKKAIRISNDWLERSSAPWIW